MAHAAAPSWIQAEAYVDNNGQWRLDGFTASDWTAVAIVRQKEGRTQEQREAQAIATALHRFTTHTEGHVV